MKRSKAQNSLALALAVVLVTSGSLTAAFGQPSGGVGNEGGTPVLSPGAQVVDPIAPATSNTRVLVPLAVAASAPSVSKDPVKVSSVISNSVGVQTATVFDKKPVAPFKNLIVGGIPNSRKDDLPYTTVNGASKKKVEVQVLQDLATSIYVSNLPPRAFALITFIDSKGNKVNVGRFQVAANGDLEIPPLTLTKADLSVQVRVTVGNLVRTLTVRSIN